MTDQAFTDPIAVADALMARKDPERLMRIGEVAESVALSPATIYRRLAAGTFPPGRDLGGTVRWRQGDIDDWKRALPIARHKP